MIRRLALMLIWVAAGATAAPPEPMQYGRAYLAEGDSAAAVKSFAEALRRNPADAAALNNMGVAKAAAGDYLAALDFLARARKLAPHRLDIKENLDQLQVWHRSHGAAASTPLPDLLAAPPALWGEPAQPGNNTMKPSPASQLNSNCGTEPCK